MGFFARLFNWKTFVGILVKDVLAQTTVGAKQEIDARADLQEPEKALLKEGIDLLVTRATTALSERL